jgi:hypothetical protein
MAIPNSTQPGSRPVRSGNNRPNRRPRRIDPYAEPDTGGVVARSLSPRPLTITLTLTDATRLVEALESSLNVTDIHAILTKKLAWTLAYNAALPTSSIKGKNPEPPVSQNSVTVSVKPQPAKRGSKRPRKRPTRQP